MVIITLIAIVLALGLGCIALAWLYDHESAASAGCIEEGQVW